MIFLSDIRATELKLAGCRGYAMLRPSGIQNENITPMTLSFNPDPVYFWEAFNSFSTRYLGCQCM